MSIAPDAYDEGTEIQVLAWRFERLVRAGFCDEDAAAIADRVEIEVHQALRLINRGCPPQLAAQILL